MPNQQKPESITWKIWKRLSPTERKKRIEEERLKKEAEEKRLLDIQRAADVFKRETEYAEQKEKERKQIIDKATKEVALDKRQKDYDIWGNRRDFQFENSNYSNNELQNLYNKLTLAGNRSVPIQSYNFNRGNDRLVQQQLHDFYQTQQEQESAGGISRMMYSLGSSLPMMVLNYGIGTTLGVGALAAGGYAAYKGASYLYDRFWKRPRQTTGVPTA